MESIVMQKMNKQIKVPEHDVESMEQMGFKIVTPQDKLETPYQRDRQPEHDVESMEQMGFKIVTPQDKLETPYQRDRQPKDRTPKE